MEGRNRKLNRWQGFDYSQAGFYFVTICAKYRIEWFGWVKDGKMILNEWGEIVRAQLEWLEKQYAYISLDIYQIMPNHVHIIFGIDVAAPHAIVGTGLDLSLQNENKILSLSHIVGAFKTTSSKLIHVRGFYEFAWQRSFHDHIIRNEIELYNIRQYIINNPINWETDRNNPRAGLLSI